MNEVICRQEMGGGLFLHAIYEPVKELVRCKDCKHCSFSDGEQFADCVIKQGWFPVKRDWFCADGERR